LIINKFKRTKGGKNQRMVPESFEGDIEERRTYYIAEKGGKLYWIKEYTDINFGDGTLQQEIDRGQKYYKKCITIIYKFL